MPPVTLTPEEKKALFEAAKKFADEARREEANLPPEIPRMPYATDEEIMANLENPEYVANYRRALQLKEDFNKREQYSKSKSDHRRDADGNLVEHNPIAVGHMERSTTAQFRPGSEAADKAFNDSLFTLFCDRDRANLNYEHYMREGLAADYSDVEEALSSTGKALDFYEKHAPGMTGFFSGEHLLSREEMNEASYTQIRNVLPFTTDLWGFYHTMTFTSTFAYFALPHVPRLELDQIGVYSTLMFSGIKHPYRHLMESMQGISTLKDIEKIVDGYKSLGGDLGPGFFRDHELVDKDGNVVKVGSKPFSELTLRTVGPEKRAQIDKMYNEEEYAEQVRRRVRVARAPESSRNPVEDQFIDPYERNEALLYAKKNELKGSLDAYRSLHWFRKIFAFSARREISRRERDLKALGATDLEVKLIKSNGCLTKAEYDRELARLAKDSQGQYVVFTRSTRAAAAEFNADAHFLSEAKVAGVDPAKVTDDVAKITDYVNERIAQFENHLQAEEGGIVFEGMDLSQAEAAREPLDVPVDEAEKIAEMPVNEPEKDAPVAEGEVIPESNK